MITTIGKVALPVLVVFFFVSSDLYHDGTYNMGYAHAQQQVQYQQQQQQQYYHQEIDKTYNRTAIVHIGPHKTGTSSIQSDIKSLLQKLQENNYYLPLDLQKNPNNINMGDLRNCFCPICKNIDQYLQWKLDCSQIQLSQISNISYAGHNIIISAETFSFHTTDIQSLYNVLTPLYENIIIVIYYRRYYDWLYSQWNQLNKLLPVEKRYPFHTWMDTPTKIIKKYSENHYTAAVVPRWKQYFTSNNNNNNTKNTFQVKLYNVHDTTISGSEKFFCDAIPDAPIACAALRQKEQMLIVNQKIDATTSGTTGSSKKEVSQFNKAKALIYDDLAYQAIQLGMVSPTLYTNSTKSITKLSNIIKIQQENIWKLNQYNFIQQSKVCFDTYRLDTILNKTLEAERILFPNNYYKQNTQQTIISKFISDSTTKFCHVNATIVLLYDSKWKLFLQSL